MLIQIGGLGVTSISAGVILAMGRRVNLKGRMLIRESMNLDAGRGLIGFVYTVFKTTLLIELIGAALSFIVFIQDYSLFRAIGVSLFHSVASFNNAGFDIFGGDDVKSSCPLRPGLHTCYNGVNKGKQEGDLERIPEITSQFGL